MSEIVSENDTLVPTTSSVTHGEQPVTRPRITAPLVNHDTDDTIKLTPKPKITVPLPSIGTDLSHYRGGAGGTRPKITVPLPSAGTDLSHPGDGGTRLQEEALPTPILSPDSTEDVINHLQPTNDDHSNHTITIVHEMILVENVTEPITPIERKNPDTPTDLPVIIVEKPDVTEDGEQIPLQEDATIETEQAQASTAGHPQGGVPLRVPWLRLPQPLRQRIAQHRIIAFLLLALLLVGIAIPVVDGVMYGLQAYSTYTTLRSRATSGVQHLLNVKTLFSSSKQGNTTISSTSKLLDTSTLLQANKELAAARNDFVQTQAIINHASVIPLVEQYAPQYRPQITSARAASRVGEDVANMGQVLIKTILTLAPRLRGPLLNTSNTPLITANDLKLIGITINDVLPYVNDIQQQSQQMSLSALPVSVHQRQQVQQLLQLLPQLKSILTQSNSYLDAAGWLLGIDGPRTFLVQTMDRGELRPTGGFTGQYGELHITGGRVGPFSLRDISLIEYADNSPTTDHSAPAAYRSWWPFANWGLRDSNLSADFPTSAQIAIDQYKLETHRQVDGVILFTPFLIEDVLRVTGPIRIPAYNETITAQNLEARLHYYQLDNAGIAKQASISGNNSSTSERKQFTSLVARTLMDNVRHSSPMTLLAIGKQMLHDLQTKDLQLYFSNPQLENLLSQQGYAAQIDTSTTHDGLYVVQANVSASKASQYVKTTLHDTVTLDANGGATHDLQMTLAYAQLGFVYGLDTYRDYVRVYVPPNAKFLAGDGFDTGTPLCGGPLAACNTNGIYAHDEMICPAGQYFAGASAPMLNDNYTGAWHPLDTIAGPTNFTSDVTGRAMFGGYVVIPKNCTMTVTLSWYVPPIGNGAYNLLVQRQAGTFPELQLTVLTSPNNCATPLAQGLYIDRVLVQDTSFALATLNSFQGGGTCSPQPDV